MTKFSQGNLRAAKLADEDIWELRRRYAAGESQASLARDYKLHINTVGRIVRGESRQRVPQPEDHGAAQRRLLELQDQRSQEVLDKLAGDLGPKLAVEKALNDLKGDR